jgi:hypothetical protein
VRDVDRRVARSVPNAAIARTAACMIYKTLVSAVSVNLFGRDSILAADRLTER